MRILFSFLLLSTSIHNFAQETSVIQSNATMLEVKEENKNSELQFNVSWRLYYALPNQIGNHVYADAYDSKFSMGTSLGLIEYSNFRLSGGFELEQYNVTDVSKAGNFDFISKYSFFGTVSYDFELNDKIILAPQIGYGSSDIHHKMRAERVANQIGTHLRLGVYADYSLGENVAIFAGIHYIRSDFDISTNSEFKNYITKSTQLQLTLGLKVH